MVTSTNMPLQYPITSYIGYWFESLGKLRLTF